MVTFCVIAVMVCSPLIMWTTEGTAQELAIIVTFCIDLPLIAYLVVVWRYAHTDRGLRNISKRKQKEEKNHNDYGYIDFSEK